MKKTAILNAQVVLEDGIIWNGALLLENGKIIKISQEREFDKSEADEIIDANGAYVGPGFVDIHVHAGGKYDTSFNPLEAVEYFIPHGHTTILPTPYFDYNFEKLMKAFASVKEALPKSKVLKGMYVEGPYLNTNYGANSALNPWKHPIDEKEYKAFVDLAGTDVRVWAISPEREGLLSFLEYARKVNPDVKFALAHSEATPAQVKALGTKYRPTIMTHTMDATGRLPVYAGTRGAGPDEYCFNQPDMYAELISDSCCIHVQADLQQMILKTKGVDKVILITDCTLENAPAPKNLEHVTDINFDAFGGIYGSKLSLDTACRNIMASTNCGIAQAFIMASTNPARAIGLDDEIGSIEVGKTADLVFVDDKFNVQKVMIEGEVAFDRK